MKRLCLADGMMLAIAFDLFALPAHAGVNVWQVEPSANDLIVLPRISTADVEPAGAVAHPCI
jgi:hypothetical protein